MRKVNIWMLGIMGLALLLYVCGCTPASSSSSGGGVSYFPHNDGYSWNYSITDGSVSVSTFEGTSVINGFTVQNLHSWARSNHGSVSTNEGYFRVTDSTVYMCFPSTTEVYTMLTFPLSVGASWTLYPSMSGMTFTALVTAKENVCVPAGTFDCYKVVYTTTYGTIESSSQTIWFGNNAGIVKSINSMTTVESTLTSKNF